MMKYCDHSDFLVVYDTRICPYCDLEDDLKIVENTKEEEIDNLKSQIEDLERGE